jgi:lipid-A-disaccharide synthase
MDKEVVKELIQDEFNAKNLKMELTKILDGKPRETMISNYNLLETQLGGIGASEKTSALIVAALKE